MSDGFREVGVAEAVTLAREGYRVIDVREQSEWDAGHVAGATLLPLGDVAARIGSVISDRAAPVIIHCAVGQRSARAAGWLAEMGYSDVVSLKGPIGRWLEAGGSWEAPSEVLTPSQNRRYAQQIRLAEVGTEGQRKLLDARVLLVGAGGLGSPVAIYLAASGIGTLAIVDDDVVEESNLHRQVLHGADRVGMRKVDSAERTLRGLNPEMRVTTHAERLTPANVVGLIETYDVIVDGTDNLETRYQLNDAAVRLRKPVVHGSIHRWDGQVTTLMPFVGPCYRCIYPSQPPPALAPDCDVTGVLGVLPGIVGLLQATEVIKLVLGVGQPLIGRVLVVDALGTTFEEMRAARDPECVTCGGGATLAHLQGTPSVALER